MKIFAEKTLESTAKMMALLFTAFIWSEPTMAATITANVSANITGGIAGTASTGLSFGDVSPGTSPGSVTVDISGFRTSVGGVSLGMSRPASPAIFQVTGIPSYTYSITSPTSLSLTDGSGNYMTVNNFTSSPSGSGGLLDAGGSQTLTVGGTLHVDANQPGGSYTGVLAMTIIYY
jgi:hypothetical protein